MNTHYTMHDPPHPGEVLKELYLIPLDLTVTEAAKALGISRKSLSAILNGKAGISIEMALRLSQCFKTLRKNKTWQVENKTCQVCVLHSFLFQLPNKHWTSKINLGLLPKIGISFHHAQILHTSKKLKIKRTTQSY
jgi:addiction module HigA family antidote